MAEVYLQIKSFLHDQFCDRSHETLWQHCTNHFRPLDNQPILQSPTIEREIRILFKTTQHWNKGEELLSTSVCVCEAQAVIVRENEKAFNLNKQKINDEKSKIGIHFVRGIFECLL